MYQKNLFIDNNNNKSLLTYIKSTAAMKTNTYAMRLNILSERCK